MSLFSSMEKGLTGGPGQAFPWLKLGDYTQASRRLANVEESIRIVKPVLRAFEGLRLFVYLCSSGVPSVGYGATYYEDGRRVTLSDPRITKERAEKLLDIQLRRDFVPAVRLLCPAIDTEERFAAITSFTFNCGVNALKNSTLRKKVNRQDWQAAAHEIKKWKYSGGQVSRGLVRRRAVEASMLFSYN